MAKEGVRESSAKKTRSNLFLYLLIALGVLVVAAAGIYAADFGTKGASGSVPNPGHPISQLQTCAAAGDTLVINSSGNWSCQQGGSGAWQTVTGGIAYNGGTVNINTSNNYELQFTGNQGANIYSPGGDFYLLAGSGKALHLGANDVNSIINIASNGNVGVGTSSPLARLDVHIASSFAPGDSYTAILGNGGTNYIGVAGEGGTGVDGDSPVSNGIGVSGTAASSGGIAVRGDGASYDFYAIGPGIDYGSASSIRWKYNISQINPKTALSKILQINGDYYNWKSDGKLDIGFIAEQIGQIVPEIVQYENPNNASNWYIDPTTGKRMLYASGVDYGKLTPVLVQAIKEQQDLITRQNETINSLNQKLNNICSNVPYLCE